MTSRADNPVAGLLDEAVRHINGGDWPLARSRLEQILRIAPAHPVAAYLQGLDEFRQGRWSDAERLFRQALASNSAPPQVCHRMGLALSRQRRHPEALPFLERAREAAPHERQIALDLAALLQHLRRYDAAAAVLEELIEQDPLDFEAHLQLNELLYRQGRDDAFLLSYDRAATRTPRPAALLTAKGRFLLKAARAAEALASFQRALALEPSDGGAMAGRGRALEALGDLEGAWAAHEASLRARPANADSHIDAAAFLLRRQQTARAKSVLLEALAVRPADQAALSLLCLCHRASGELREESWLAGYDELVATYDLPPPEGYGSMLDFNRELAAYLEPLHDDKREHFTQTLRGGTRLYGEMFDSGHLLVQRLRGRIDAAVAHYIAHLRADDRHPFLARRAARFCYVSSWSSRLVDRGFHLNHVHPQGWISSAYYVSVPQVCRDGERREGWLKLGEPTEDFGGRFPPRRCVQPLPGRLVLFPSYLWHGTVPFASSQARMTIAFDVAPLGPPPAAGR